MSIGLIGRKLGMTRVFNQDGKSVPVTVIQVEANRVTQIKNIETDGYCAIQVTTGERKTSRMTKAEGFEIYRLYNPWPAAEVAEAWGDAMSATNDVPEYLQFTINEDGSIDWRNDVQTVEVCMAVM